MSLFFDTQSVTLTGISNNYLSSYEIPNFIDCYYLKDISNNTINLSDFVDSGVGLVEINDFIDCGLLSSNSYFEESNRTFVYPLSIIQGHTKITFDFSNFDETQSKINKIFYEYNNLVTELTGKSNFEIIVYPVSNYIETFFIYLSVLRYDTTLNKIVLSGSIIPQGVSTGLDDTNLLDAQVLDNVKDTMVVIEDSNERYLLFNTLKGYKTGNGEELSIVFKEEEEAFYEGISNFGFSPLVPIEPLPSPTPTPTPTPTVTPTPTPTVTPTPGDLGIVTFESVQIQTFVGDDMYPFS